MSALHGPIKVATLGQLREMVASLDALPADTAIAFSMTDEELDALRTPDPHTFEGTALIVDAVDSAEHHSIVIAPWKWVGA